VKLDARPMIPGEARIQWLQDGTASGAYFRNLKWMTFYQAG